MGLKVEMIKVKSGNFALSDFEGEIELMKWKFQVLRVFTLVQGGLGCFQLELLFFVLSDGDVLNVLRPNRAFVSFNVYVFLRLTLHSLWILQFVPAFWSLHENTDVCDGYWGGTFFYKQCEFFVQW